MNFSRTLINRALLGALLLTAPLMWYACSQTVNPSSKSSGSIKMYMTDAPASYDSVVVFINRIEVHAVDSSDATGWTVVRGDSVRYDLLVLRNGARAVLGTNALVVGHYTQIRLIVGEGSYVIDGGVKHALIIPSGMQSGIKLTHGFDIAGGVTYELLLDFDAEKSINVTGGGKYMMNPVIHASAVAATGSMRGVIFPASAHTLVWTTMGVDTIATVADYLTGVFVLPGLLDGSYSISCTPGNTAYRDTIVTGINVLRLNETAVGTVVLTLR